MHHMQMAGFEFENINCNSSTEDAFNYLLKIFIRANCYVRNISFHFHHAFNGSLCDTKLRWTFHLPDRKCVRLPFEFETENALKVWSTWIEWEIFCILAKGFSTSVSIHRQSIRHSSPVDLQIPGLRLFIRTRSQSFEWSSLIDGRQGIIGVNTWPTAN